MEQLDKRRRPSPEMIQEETHETSSAEAKTCEVEAIPETEVLDQWRARNRARRVARLQQEAQRKADDFLVKVDRLLSSMIAEGEPASLNNRGPRGLGSLTNFQRIAMEGSEEATPECMVATREIPFTVWTLRPESEMGRVLYAKLETVHTQFKARIEALKAHLLGELEIAWPQFTSKNYESGNGWGADPESPVLNKRAADLPGWVVEFLQHTPRIEFDETSKIRIISRDSNGTVCVVVREDEEWSELRMRLQTEHGLAQARQVRQAVLSFLRTGENAQGEFRVIEENGYDGYLSVTRVGGGAFHTSTQWALKALGMKANLFTHEVHMR